MILLSIYLLYKGFGEGIFGNVFMKFTNPVRYDIDIYLDFLWVSVWKILFFASTYGNEYHICKFDLLFGRGAISEKINRKGKACVLR